jgi:hypothetical protein
MPRFSASGDKLQIDSALILRTYDFDPGAVCRSVILPRQAMAIQQPTVNKFALHPESPYLIVPSDGGLMLVDTIRTATTKRWPIHAHDVAFNTTGTHLIIGGRTITRVPISKNVEGQWIAGLPGLVAMNPADDPVVFLQCSADAETIVGWHAKGSWSVFQPGKGARSLGSTMGASQSFSVGHEGKSMIHGTVNQGCRVLDLQTGQPSALIAGQGDWPQCTFTPDRKGLVVSDAIGIRMLQANTWKPIWQNNQGARSTIGSFAWMDPAGTYVIHAPQAGILTLLDSATGQEALTLRRERETSAHFVALTADLSQLWQLDAVSQVLWRWDLGALRRYLRPLGLDWSTTPLPSVPPTEAPPLQGWLNMLPEKPE